MESSYRTLLRLYTIYCLFIGVLNRRWINIDVLDMGWKFTCHWKWLIDEPKEKTISIYTHVNTQNQFIDMMHYVELCIWNGWIVGNSWSIYGTVCFFQEVNYEWADSRIPSKKQCWYWIGYWMLMDQVWFDWLCSCFATILVHVRNLIAFNYLNELELMNKKECDKKPTICNTVTASIIPHK